MPSAWHSKTDSRKGNDQFRRPRCPDGRPVHGWPGPHAGPRGPVVAEAPAAVLGADAGALRPLLPLLARARRVGEGEAHVRVGGVPRVVGCGRGYVASGHRKQSGRGCEYDNWCAVQKETGTQVSIKRAHAD